MFLYFIVVYKLFSDKNVLKILTLCTKKEHFSYQFAHHGYLMSCPGLIELIIFYSNFAT